MSGRYNNDMEDVMRILEENETLKVAGGNADLADAAKLAEQTCGKDNVESVKVEYNEDGTKKSISFTCKQGASKKGDG